MADSATTGSQTLTQTQRNVVLVVCFLSWFFGGVQIAITNVAMRAASLELLDRVGELDLERFHQLQLQNKDALSEVDRQDLTSWNGSASRWYAWFQCAFLFGAAAGGFVFGRLGDRIGRTRTLAISIVCFGALTGASYFAQSPVQLLVLRFLACVGIGGTWPNCVSLVSEAWKNAARPLVASSIGMAGNLGIFAMFTLASQESWLVTPDQWRWVMIVGATPVVLGVVTWMFVPESPTWTALRDRTSSGDGRSDEQDAPTQQAGYHKAILIGIVLATVPLAGGWGSANWMMPWAGEVGGATGNDALKAHVGQARAITSIVGSLLAGWIASTIGRRRSYALTSLGALAVAQYAFWFTTPTDSSFLIWVALLGFFNGVYFGWLPFFLPELFDARVRSTGTGVSFNSGRILTAITIFTTAAMLDYFQGDYALIGRVTSWVFLLGIAAIAFAPDTSQKDMDK